MHPVCLCLGGVWGPSPVCWRHQRSRFTPGAAGQLLVRCRLLQFGLQRVSVAKSERFFLYVFVCSHFDIPCVLTKLVLEVNCVVVPRGYRQIPTVCWAAAEVWMFHCAKLTRFPPHQTFVCDIGQRKNCSSGQIKPRAQISPEMLAAKHHDETLSSGSFESWTLAFTANCLKLC